MELEPRGMLLVLAVIQVQLLLRLVLLIGQQGPLALPSLMGKLLAASGIGSATEKQTAALTFITTTVTVRLITEIFDSVMTNILPYAPGFHWFWRLLDGYLDGGWVAVKQIALIRRESPTLLITHLSVHR